MAVKFKFTRYDFANNLNMPESQHQERHLEHWAAQGWAMEATDLNDVYLGVLWRKDGEPAPDQSARIAELESERDAAQERARQAESSRDDLDRQVSQLVAERDQARELARQLQVREAEVPASVQTGDVPLP